MDIKMEICGKSAEFEEVNCTSEEENVFKSCILKTGGLSL